LIPMSGNKFSPNPWLVDHRPETYMGMGLTAEQLQRKYSIGREQQDAFSLRSHQNALRAQAEGKFEHEVVPLEVESNVLNNGHALHQKVVFQKDEGPRADTSMAAL